jgi:hypothetical protein
MSIKNSKSFLFFTSVFLLFIIGCIRNAEAQEVGGIGIHGNLQFDAQYYKQDSVIGATDVPEKLLSNGFANFTFEKDNFSAGLRYESYLNPMLGFPTPAGNGIPYRYLTYKNQELEFTVGNFYEQFGSGLVFRCYEDRGLGYDNAMDGIRVKYNPIKGLYFKGLLGKQRNYWENGEGIVRGIDGEINLNETFGDGAQKKTNWIIGGSFVSKYQDDQNSVYVLPKNVGAGAGRINMIHGDLNVRLELAYKANDPSYDNSYIYKDGNAALLNINYSKKGFGVAFGAKRIDNMSFRSDRTASQNSLMINYLPAMTKEHTNILPAFYPYATQPNGELGIQGEVFFNLKPSSSLGGNYGTDVTLNYSRATDIAKNPTGDDIGYTSDYFKFGNAIFFQDFNIEINRKLSKQVRMILSYVWIDYNKDVVQGRPGFGHIYSNIGVAEFNWKLTPKRAIRTELQNLYTKQDQQSWALWLVEYTISPHWFFAGFDEYNYGNKIKEDRLHYFSISTGYTRNTNRISIGYGRQRAGIFCVGGVCRTVPASNGFTLSITSSF